MQCLECGAIVPDGIVQCDSCGAPLSEVMSPVPSAVSEGGSPYFEPAWAEHSGVSVPVEMPAGVAAPSLSILPAPGGYMPPGNYPNIPDSIRPGFVPPVAPTPKRWRPSLTVILLLLLIFGGVFVGIRIGQSRYNVSTNLPALTPTGNSTLNASQLYQQLTSQKPFVADSLQDASSSIWTVFEKPKYGCEIKSDGLHVHISDPNHFTYCTSGRGRFSNFGFQVEMRMLSGTGGGLTLRGDTTAGNLYFFHVFPDGQYHIFIDQNHNLTTELSEGTISSFTHGPGQKNTLAVIAQGSHMYFYVNQKFVTQVQDSTYSNGFVGVTAGDATEPADVIYTNAQIWVL